MSARISMILVVFVLAMLGGCQSSGRGEGGGGTERVMASITGSVAYRQRIALPPDAIIHVRLEDVSKADAPAELIAERDFTSDGRQVPIDFTLQYDASRIHPTGRYHVRASITSGDRLLFTTTAAQPVITHGSLSEAHLVLEQPSSAPPPAAAAGFEDVEWRLAEIDGVPALPSEGPRQAGITFVSKGRTIAANTSVNGMGGSYQIEGERLTVEPGMMTLMAGPEPLMNQERAFIAALKRVTGWRVSDQTLELLAGATVIMKFTRAS